MHLQAVVPINAVMNYSVYKFQVRDEAGDGDKNVRFKMITDDR